MSLPSFLPGGPIVSVVDGVLGSQYLDKKELYSNTLFKKRLSTET